jgi:hypothetical protein
VSSQVICTYHVLCTMHYVLCILVVRGAAVELTRTCRYRMLQYTPGCSQASPRHLDPGSLDTLCRVPKGACPSPSYTLVCKAACAGNAIFIYYFRSHHLSIVWRSGGTHIIWGRTLAEFSETVTFPSSSRRQQYVGFFDKGL